MDRWFFMILRAVILRENIPTARLFGLGTIVIKKGGQALSPRGELYTKENIGGRLNMRDFMDTMRSSGEHTGGPPPLHARDKMAFANQLDRILTQLTR